MRALIGLVCVAGAVGSANAQLIVGVDDPATPVYGLNVNGGSWTALFTPGTSDVWGMAADDASGILYYNSGTSLYKVPYNTLVPELVGLINVGGTNKSMVSLAFANGVLYATSNIGGDGGATPEGMYSIDTGNAGATVVYDYASADYDFGGIDYDGVTGKFYGTSDDSSPLGTGLYEIDPFGQSISFVAAYPAGETDIDGLATGGGNAYFVTDQPGDIYVYDLVGGSFGASITNPWGASEVFSGGAWAPGLIPSPGTLGLMAIGGIVFNRRRR